MRCALGLTMLVFSVFSNVAFAELRAGAAISDVTPKSFPVLVNGGMTSRTTSEVTTRINARAIVVSDGNETIGIVVVDSCMMPRPLLDEAKQLAAKQTRLQPDRILISATHTHTAPSSMGALGTDAQEDYLPVLRAGIAEALVKAEANLEPAKVGWAVTDANQFTALRRWILRPDRMIDDPFGNKTVRANMHVGKDWGNVTGESGPEDPDLSLISFQALDGRPIAVLANFSMHYFSGQKALAADYFGLFCDGLQQQLKHSDSSKPPFVGIMSHGCSGDIWRRDYRMPADQQVAYGEIGEYTTELLKLAVKAYHGMSYSTQGPVSMAEARPTLAYRLPDAQRLEWANRVIAEMGDAPLKTREQVYAREQIILDKLKEAEIVVQGIRIGGIGIASTPNETYALTGLKIKNQSPLKTTIVIELANGGDGYIPPPEQHVLGGYNTWAARSAGLEVQAEPKITELALQMLESASQLPRRTYAQTQGPVSERLRAAQPAAWFRLDEMSGPIAIDSTGNGCVGAFESAVAFFLKGPEQNGICQAGEVNRSVHFAGGRMLTAPAVNGSQYSVGLWIWNGMPDESRDVAGWFYSRDHNFGVSTAGEHLGLGGADANAGKLILRLGQKEVAGQSKINRWEWNHVLLVRDGSAIRVHLNGNSKPEIQVLADGPSPPSWFFGGRSDSVDNWEGRLDEIVVFDRVLSPSEIRDLFSTR